MASEESTEVAVATLGERLGALRLCEAPALEAMQRSLARHGQMTVPRADPSPAPVLFGTQRINPIAAALDAGDGHVILL